MSYTRRTTIDQHQGTHPSGTRIMQMTEIVTDLAVPAGKPYAELSHADRAWWDQVVDEIHAVEVEIASLDVDERQAVRDALAADAGAAPDLEDEAAWMRRVMTEVLAEREAVRSAAATLGRKGGRVGGRSTSERKAQAARANGAKGGRPRKLRGED